MKRLSLVMMFITITALLSSRANAAQSMGEWMEQSDDWQIGYIVGIMGGVSEYCQELQFHEGLQKTTGDGQALALIKQVFRKIAKEEPKWWSYRPQDIVPMLIFNNAATACKGTPS